MLGAMNFWIFSQKKSIVFWVFEVLERIFFLCDGGGGGSERIKIKSRLKVIEI